ncbi:hypothetical protein [Telmatospirillum siberiense]|uniref:Uncharacterized protein n=1 Tax=Telmatospirillum siberiense TaxID=382514 RepID=A0A2N3PNK0_9PROT|nr:hypothetical protein [Telmatospirillum siberiense]PKU21979.1 hypothetical protein CWS72_24045 [Telmatospirillum siberiense]
MRGFGPALFGLFFISLPAAAQSVSSPTLTSPLGQQTQTGLSGALGSSNNSSSGGTGQGQGTKKSGNNGQNVGTVTLQEPEKATVIDVPKLGQVTPQRYDMKAETFANARGASLMNELVDPAYHAESTTGATEVTASSEAAPIPGDNRLP